MRRPAALATAVLAASVLGGPTAASAQPVGDAPVDPLVSLLDLLDGTGVDVDPLEVGLTQLQEVAEAQLAPAGAPAPAPAQPGVSDAPATAAASPDRPDNSRVAVAVMAVSLSLLAAGLVLDQLRKARVPIRL